MACCRCAVSPQLTYYAGRVVVPDSEFVTFELTNGIKLPWLRYFGWLVTVPLLLMFLVSLTVHGGRSATVWPHRERVRLSGNPKPEPDH